MFLKNTLVFRFVHFIRTLSHPEFEEMEDRRDHRLRLRSSICLKRLDIFYKIFSSVLVATERQNQNFLLTNGSMCLNKTWPWSHHCDNIQKLIKKKTSRNVMLQQLCGLQKLTVVTFIHVIGSVLQQVRNPQKSGCRMTLCPSAALRHPIMIQKQLKN